jgi:lipopolysaccharide/colanic/teichoic acid biosynthesis glycosyltransferase
MANEYSKMLKMTDEQIIKHIDESSGYANPPQNYVSELWRRNQDKQIKEQAKQIEEQIKQTDILKRLTWWIFTFTLVVMISTFLQIAIALKWIEQ